MFTSPVREAQVSSTRVRSFIFLCIADALCSAAQQLRIEFSPAPKMPGDVPEHGRLSTRWQAKSQGCQLT